jgi:hypothetical protein
MNPGGMSIRNANAASMMPAISVRLLRLPQLKPISQEFFWQENLISKRQAK